MIEVRRGPLGLPGGEVIDPLAGTPVSLSRPLSLVVGGSKADVRVVARFSRRGLRRLEPPCLVVRDMLDLASAVREGDGSRRNCSCCRAPSRSGGQRASGDAEPRART